MVHAAEHTAEAAAEAAAAKELGKEVLSSHTTCPSAALESSLAILVVKLTLLGICKNLVRM